MKYNLIYRALDDGKRIIKDIQKDKQFIVLSNLISNARYSFILSASTSAGTGETEEIEFDFSKGKFLKISPANIFLFKISKKKKKKKNARKRCKICSKLTIRIPELPLGRCSGVFIVNFECISHLFLVFQLLTL